MFRSLPFEMSSMYTFYKKRQRSLVFMCVKKKKKKNRTETECQHYYYNCLNSRPSKREHGRMQSLGTVSCFDMEYAPSWSTTAKTLTRGLGGYVDMGGER